MLEQKVQLKQESDVALLCEAANACKDFQIEILSGNYVIDAKSILSIYSLMNRGVLTLRIAAEEEQAATFLKQITPIVCKDIRTSP